jgi:hypothetical protein
MIEKTTITNIGSKLNCFKVFMVKWFKGYNFNIFTYKQGLTQIYELINIFVK